MNAPLDMSAFIAPKSDQMNADDLIGGSRTITITRVSASPDSPEQPVSVYFDGDEGKPFKPCKSMRRVMVAIWGPDAAQYVGRSMTLYRDPKVAFGGMQVGGIRISHMTHMEREVVIALTATRAKRAPYKVLPLEVKAKQQAQANEPGADVTAWVDDLIERIRHAASAEAILAIENEGMVIKRRQWMEKAHPDLAARITAAFTAGPAVEGRADEQHGDQFPGDEA